MIRSLPRLLCLLLALAFSLPAFAQKSDVVVLKNGDKITGEVKSLLRGKLEFSTDSMGTVFIEWKDIEAVISDTSQSLELANGQRFFGPLRKSESTEMVAIDTQQGTVGVGILDVVGMYPVEATFWERLDLKTLFGFSWDKASDVGRYNLELDAEYRTQDHLTRIGLFGELTTQDERDDTSRSNFDINHARFKENKRFVSYFGNLEKNDELGIDLRALAGIAYGRIPIRSNNNLFMMSAGIDVNHEIPVDGDSETNLEAVGRVAYEYFKYADPERSFNVSLTVFPSITDWGRWRADFKTDLDIEFYKDFSWVLSFFANYDNDPVAVGGSSSDYGIRSAIGYEW